MNKERKIRITYALFGTGQNAPDKVNKIPYVFTVKILSSVYTADGSNIKVDDTKMAGVFGKNIDVKDGLSATYAAGINVGKALNLFTVNADEQLITNYQNYNSSVSNEGYLLDASGKPIEISKDDLIAFGMSVSDYTQVQDNQHFYLMTATGYKNVYSIMVSMLII